MHPFIAKFFRNIGLADELGSGMRNLYKYSKPYSGKDPVLDDGDVFEAFVPVRWMEGDVAAGDLSVHSKDEHNQDETANDPSEQINDPDGTVNGTVNGLTERERLLLNLIGDNPSLTYRQAASALGVSYNTIWRALQTMRGNGLITREGSDRRGTWRILTPSQPSRE